MELNQARSIHREQAEPRYNEAMKKQTYQTMTAFLRNHPAQAKAALGANKAITYAIYLAYPCLLAWLLFSGGATDLCAGTFDTPFSRAFLVPAISFVLVSLFRKAFNAPRPYEVFGIAPVIPKNTVGKSFPSRHTFSIFVIGMAFLATCPLPWAGWLVLALGVCLACIRVLAGVHFPRDVIAGALFGIFCGWIGFWVL